MTDRQLYKALKQIQKGSMDFNRLTLICQKLNDMGLTRVVGTPNASRFELTIQGKVIIWDWENWKLLS